MKPQHEPPTVPPLPDIIFTYFFRDFLVAACARVRGATARDRAGAVREADGHNGSTCGGGGERVPRAMARA